jgi:hypothetical protein
MTSNVTNDGKGEARLTYVLLLVKNNVRNLKTKFTFRALVFSLLLTAVLSVNSYSWSATGHMVVAFVAYKNLKPDIRARIDTLVALNPKIDQWRAMIPAGTSAADAKMMLFMIAATFPDQIKGDGEHHADGTDGGNTPPTDGTAARNIGYSDTAMHKYWHFIDMPFSQDGTPLINPSVPNAKTQIPVFRAVLASTASDALKSYDLVWLLHLVGDVHQPLHATSRFSRVLPKGDNGGNSVSICSPQCGNNELHAFWDGIFGTTSNPKRAITVGKGLQPAPQNLANDLDESDWINESFGFAKTVVYKQPPIGNGKGPFTITASYRSTAITVASKRVALGGARMANILNNELK